MPKDSIFEAQDCILHSSQVGCFGMYTEFIIRFLEKSYISHTYMLWENHLKKHTKKHFLA